MGHFSKKGKTKSGEGNSTRVPTMTGRKGNLRGKRRSSKRVRKLPINATIIELKRYRYKIEKLSNEPKK